MSEISKEVIMSMSLSEIEAHFLQLKTYELKEWFEYLKQLDLEGDLGGSDPSILEREKEKSKQIIKILSEIIRVRESAQIKHFGQLLSKKCEDYLTLNFPGITNIHEKRIIDPTKPPITPFKKAIDDNDLPMIKELLKIDHDKNYLAEFSNTDDILNHIFELEQNTFEFIVDWLLKEKNEIAQSALLEMFKIFWTHEKLEKQFQSKVNYLLEKIKVQKLDIVQSKDKKYNFYEIFDDFIYQFYRYEVNFKKLDILRDLLPKKIIEITDPEIVNNVKNAIGKLFEELEAIQRYFHVGTFDVVTEKFIKDDKQEQIIFQKEEALKKILFTIINFVPEAMYEEVAEEAKKYPEILETAFVTKDLELAKMLLEFGVKPSVGLIEKLIDSKNEDFIALISKYCGSEKILDLYLDYLNLEKYVQRDSLYYLMSLNLLWTQAQQDQLLKLIPELYIKGKEDKDNVAQDFIDKFSGKKKFELPFVLDEKINFDVTMDDNLFGHIHNDHALSGTILEGGTISRSLKYLCNFFEQIKNNTWVIEGIDDRKKQQYINKATKIQEVLKECLRVANTMDNILQKENRQKITPNRALSLMTELYTKSILEKKEGLYPGGWRGLNNTTGHAMLYEFKETEEGMIFLIHNTGAGINFHLSREQENATYYSSVKAFRLPKEIPGNREDKIKYLVQTLLKAEIYPAYGLESYSAEKLYGNINEATHKCGFLEIDPGPYNREWTQGQKSGTCSWRAFRSYFKSLDKQQDDKLSDKKEEEELSYDEMSYEIKLHSLLKYFDTQKDRLNVATVQRQLSFGLQNLARHIRALSNKTPPLSEQRRANGLKVIQKINEALALKHPFSARYKGKDLPQYISEESLMSKNFAEPYLSPLPEQLLHKVEIIVTKESKMLESKVETVKRPLDNVLKFDQKHILESLQTLLEQCQKNYEAGFINKVALDIEKFYLTLPLEESFWQQLSSLDLKKSIHAIQQLNAFYASSSAKKNVVPFAEQTITLLTGQVIATQMLTEYFKDNKAIVQNFLQDTLDINNTLSTFRNSSFCITCDPKLQVHQTEIENYYKRSAGLVDKENLQKLTLFQQIICKNTNSKLKILKLCEVDAKFLNEIKALGHENVPPDILASYYYLNNRSSLKIDFPEIEEELNIILALKKISFESNLWDQGKCDALLDKNPSKIPMEIFQENKKLFLIKDPESGVYSLNVTAGFETIYCSKEKNLLSASQPPIANPSIKSVIDSEPKKSNEIQTEHEQGIVDVQVALKRTLQNTKIDKRIQVAATIDLLKRELFRAEDPSFQNFIFLNLFHSDLLITQIEASKEILDDLIGLIERGLNNFTKHNRLQKPVFFFLKLSCLLALMLKNTPKESKVYEEALAQLSKINAFIIKNIAHYEEIAQKIPSTQLKENLLSLHNLNILRINNNLMEGNFTDSDLNQLIEAIFFRNFYQTKEEDPFIQHQISKILTQHESLLAQHFEKLKEKNNENFQKFLNGILGKNNIAVLEKNANWTGSFPNYNLVNDKGTRLIALDLNTGQILQGEKQYGPIPREIYSDPVFKEFFKDKTIMAYQSADHKTFEFEIKGVKYRFILESPTKETPVMSILQKEIDMNGKKEWYQYYDGSNCQDLPIHFREQGLKTWISLIKKEEKDQQTVIMDETKNKVLYTYDSQGNVKELNENALWTGYQLLNLQQSIAPFAQFEDPKFIEIWQKENEDKSRELKIKLPRYGLEFKQIISNTGVPSDLIWQQDKRYKIKFNPEYDVLPNFKAVLRLEKIVPTEKKSLSEGLAGDSEKVPEEETKEESEELALIPKQQFIATKNKQAEYYNLEFDNKGEVLKKTLNNNAIIPDPLLEKNPALQKWTNQEKYACYKVLSSLTLIPQNTEDRFYLAYLYLAKRQPLLALETLKTVLKESQSMNNDQIEWLRRIMLEIPIRLKGNPVEIHIENQARINTAEFESVRAMAAFILVQQKIKQVKISPSKDLIDQDLTLRTATKDYEKLSLMKLEKFWQEPSFSLEIMETMKNYYDKSSKLPEGLYLDPHQESMLLSHISKQISNLPTNLNYRKKELISLRLKIERDRLETLKKRHGDKLSKGLEKRLALLNKKLSQVTSIQASYTDFQTVNILLAPNRNIIFPYPSDYRLLGGDISILKANRIPIDQLSGLEDDSDFIFSFRGYFDLATSKDNEEAKKILERGIQTSLDSCAKKLRHDPSTVLSLRENLTILLAYVLKYPEAFPQKAITKDNCEEAMNIIHRLINQDKKVVATLNIQVSRKKSLAIKDKMPRPEIPLVQDLPEVEFTDIPYQDEKMKFKNNLQQEVVKSLDVKENLEFIHITKELPSIKQILYQEILDDYQEGVKKNNETSALNQVSQVFYDSTKNQVQILNTLNAKLNKAITEINQATEELISEILQLANQPPESAEKLLDWSLQKEALKRKDLSFEDVLHLYLMQDKALFQFKTTLNDENIKKLNAMIHVYLLKATQRQQYERVNSEIVKCQDKKLSSEKLTNSINQIGQLLTRERCYDPKKHPEILLFEYLENKQIYSEQFNYLSDLLTQSENGFKSQAVQLIMGGGKSKVLLPLLALKKATGTNLSIIEVPEALFQINKVDLNATTEKLFGKKAHDFYFDDSVECNLSYLKNLRQALRLAILNREYLITTKESMQAFELKFLKFIKYADLDNPDNIQIAKLSNEILQVFRVQGDVMVDEWDSTQDVRKQLIFRTGKGENAPAHEVKALLNLHLFFKHVAVKLENEKEACTLEQILLGEKTPRDLEWPMIYQTLAEILINDPKSPLASIVEQMTKESKTDSEIEKSVEIEKNIEIKRSLIDYLLSKNSTTPLTIQNLPPNAKDQLALIREEIANILPLLFKKNKEEHFGFSNDPDKSVIDREIAIPFIASNTPNEKSKFGNYLETINYTLRLQLYKPLSLELVKMMLQDFSIRESEEHRILSLRKPKDYQSPALQFFNLTGVKLSEIDEDDPDAFQAFYEKVNSNAELKYYCLSHYILNNVEKNAEILASNAQDHARQFRSVQGMTGTDWNYRCNPHFVEQKKRVSLGTDGKVRHYLKRNPASLHSICSSAENPENKFSSVINLFTHHPNKKSLHAWIDLGAFFKGISNKKVSQKLSQFFSKTSGFEHLKYILYFDRDNKLYALPVAPTEETMIPILLEKTDPDYIQGKLGCGPENYFTYYDQRRITGTDIKQESGAHAFVPIGLKTLDHDLLQAVMRLRELKNDQRIEFLIPKEVQEAHPEIKVWNADAIMGLCIDNQVSRLAEDHYRSALQKIRSHMRNDLLVRLLAIDDPIVQQKLMKTFNSAFFTLSQKSAFDLYGGVKKLESTEKVLVTFKDSIIKQWSSILSEAKITAEEKEMTQFKESLDEIVQSSIEICHENVQQLSAEFDESLLDSEVEVEAEEETETAEEVEQETDYRIRGKVEPLQATFLSKMDFSKFSIKEGKTTGSFVMEPLETMAKSGVKEDEKVRTSPRSWHFANNIMVTRNFSHTYQEQAQLMDAYKKESTFYIVEQDDKKGEIKFLLVIPEEAAHAKTALQNYEEKDPNKHIWIETVHNTVIAGKKPKNLHPEYQDGVDQIAYANADTDILYQGFSKKSWLAEKPQEKIQYLRTVIQPIHKDKVDMSLPLQFKLQQECNLTTKDFLMDYSEKSEIQPQVTKQAPEQVIIPGTGIDF